MKVLVYVNKEKDSEGKWENKLKTILENNGIDYSFISYDNLKNDKTADAIIVLGGDGTILGLTAFAADNNIPIIGINAGKLGFLTEFEKFESEEAVSLLLKNKLKKDNRAIVGVKYDGKEYLALNDIVVQRFFSESSRGMILNLDVKIDGKMVDKIAGDGVIVCTPTGSTAYSLSAGGAILAPGINAFSITPISAHSLSNRPVVYSADNDCSVSIKSKDKACLFVDGKFIDYITNGETLTLSKSDRQVTFLRREDYNFFTRLTEKLRERKNND